MLHFKDCVTRGIYYWNSGISDYVAWSQKMIGDFGTDIIPQMKYIRGWSLALGSATDDAAKLNCWQFMGCGKQKIEDRSSCPTNTCPCPASIEKSFDGIHGGKNAGRACWSVLRTQCYGSVQKTLEQKYQTCLSCDFYHFVIDEEDTHFLTSCGIRRA